MTRVSQGFWDQLVSAYEVADRAAEVAFANYDAVPLPDNDSSGSEEERRYEELRKAADDLADKILGVVAPSPVAAGLQLRIFAERYHATDVANAPMQGEDPEGAMLRRIYQALVAA